MPKIRRYIFTVLVVIKCSPLKFPERHYQTEAGVTSLAFSQKRSNLLAVIECRKDVSVFNNFSLIRLVYSMELSAFSIWIITILLRSLIPSTIQHQKIDNPLFFSGCDKKHTDPVWQIEWNEFDRSSALNHTETLLSISSDGRITQWILRKEFEGIGMFIVNHNSFELTMT